MFLLCAYSQGCTRSARSGPIIIMNYEQRLVELMRTCFDDLSLDRMSGANVGSTPPSSTHRLLLTCGTT
jgi:hypothetical protein